MYISFSFYVFVARMHDTRLAESARNDNHWPFARVQLLLHFVVWRTEEMGRDGESQKDAKSIFKSKENKRRVRNAEQRAANKRSARDVSAD